MMDEQPVIDEVRLTLECGGFLDAEADAWMHKPHPPTYRVRVRFRLIAYDLRFVAIAAEFPEPEFTDKHFVATNMRMRAERFRAKVFAGCRLS
jgi:hypothetical protein